jgi:hypothetical protein
VRNKPLPLRCYTYWISDRTFRDCHISESWVIYAIKLTALKTRIQRTLGVGIALRSDHRQPWRTAERRVDGVDTDTAGR